MPVADPAGRELRDYLAVLRRRKGTIVLTVVAAVAAALLASFLQDEVYEARARVLLKPRQSLFTTALVARGISSAEVETEMQFIQSEPVQKAAQERMGLRPAVGVSAVGSTSVVEVKVRGKDAQEAAELANGYVNAYIDFRRKAAIDELQASAKELQTRVNDLQVRIDELAVQLGGVVCTSQNPAGCAQRQALQGDRDVLLNQQAPLKSKLDQFLLDSSLTGAGAELIAPAAVPTSPVQPRPVRNGLVAVGVGLILGIALVLLLDHLDDSLKSKEDLERVSQDLPVLGMIPAVENWKNKAETPLISRAEPNSQTAEAYRTLRTSIQFSGIDRSLRTITISSPSAAEGKTTTTANLAVALARAGQRVVVVSCDLRRPRIHEFFGLKNEVGFTSVLLGELPLSQALQPVADEKGLFLVGSGPLPPNPSELLASNRADEVLRALAAKHDTVLLDCSPVLPVTDAAVLSSKADGTLLVVTAGSTTGKQVARAVELLRQVGAPLIGTVLNGIPPGGTYGYAGYYYRRPGAVPEDAKPAPEKWRESVTPLSVKSVVPPGS